jgi:hypothetical protein
MKEVIENLKKQRHAIVEQVNAYGKQNGSLAAIQAEQAKLQQVNQQIEYFEDLKEDGSPKK